MIYVCDAIMGSGKSSSVITYINEHPEKRFLYITPYVDEAERIVNHCKGVQLYEAEAKPRFGNSKTLYTEYLVDQGLSVATTHAAFYRYRPTLLEKLKEKDYTLIIDENLSPLKSVNTDIKYLRLLEELGRVCQIEPNVYHLVDPEDQNNMDTELWQIMRSHDVIVTQNNKSTECFFWVLPPSFLESFVDVIILTYLFEGQGLYQMLQMYDMDYEPMGITHDEETGRYCFDVNGTYIPSYVAEIRDKVSILDYPKMNKIGNDTYALSINWFKRNPEEIPKLRRHINNYFRNKCYVEAEQRLWSTYTDYEKQLTGDGYNSRFLAFNKRAVNKYKESTVLVYAVNLFFHRGQLIFFRDRGVKIDDDLYALSTMIQWIWRSAIRDGHDISIYIPSRRMRELLQNWLDSLADTKEAA